jgi:hypothetical protein
MGEEKTTEELIRILDNFKLEFLPWILKFKIPAQSPSPVPAQTQSPVQSPTPVTAPSPTPSLSPVLGVRISPVPSPPLSNFSGKVPVPVSKLTYLKRVLGMRRYKCQKIIDEILFIYQDNKAKTRLIKSIRNDPLKLKIMMKKKMF